MKIKSNVEIDGVKFYSVKQIKELLSYIAFSDLETSKTWLEDGDDASLRLAANTLSSCNHIKSLVKRLDNYIC